MCISNAAGLKASRRIEAEEIARRPLYHAALMVAAGDADGGVGGAINTTAETVRAALHCIGPAAAVHTVSGVFFMCVQDRSFGHDGVLAFADCAMVVDPSAVEVAEIAIATAQSTRAVIGAEPRVALLSFSTKGSARHAFAEKMIEALRILRQRAPGILTPTANCKATRLWSRPWAHRRRPDRAWRAAPTR